MCEGTDSIDTAPVANTKHSVRGRVAWQAGRVGHVLSSGQVARRASSLAPRKVKPLDVRAEEEERGGGRRWECDGNKTTRRCLTAVTQGGLCFPHVPHALPCTALHARAAAVAVHHRACVCTCPMDAMFSVSGAWLPLWCVARSHG